MKLREDLFWMVVYLVLGYGFRLTFESVVILGDVGVEIYVSLSRFF